MSKPIIDKDGKKRWFNKDKFVDALKSYEKSITQKALLEEISKRTNYSIDTVKDWKKKRYSPRDIEAVYIIENLFNMKKGDLLLD